MKCFIIVEKTTTGYSAYSPEIEGCIATGPTIEEVKTNMKESIKFHIEGLKKERLHLPKAKVCSIYQEEIAI